MADLRDSGGTSRLGANDPRRLIELQYFNDEAGCERQESDAQCARPGTKSAQAKEHHRCPQRIAWVLSKEL